jgi:cytochrome c-type biogenesis protein CcmH
MIKIKITLFFALLNLNIAQAGALEIDQGKIFKNLRCLICQGQSVADSNSEFAQTLKLVVKDQIEKGKTEKEIYQFLIDKYGEWIVYNPPLNKYNFILWSLPYLVFLLGGFFIFFIIRKNKDK